MQRNECDVLLSASDLMRFAGCAHATTLDLAWMMGRGTAPVEDSEDAELLQRHGDAHEARHLARLKAAGRGVVEIVRDGVPLAQGVAATRAALERGAEVVFQGALAGGAWGGWSDFLERVERPSALGNWSYEVADTKLKRKPHPKHVLQLALYSDLLAEVQGLAPRHAHVELGDGSRATIRLVGVAAYARRARARLERFVADPQPTRPMPCADCPLCRWRDHCAEDLAAKDSLFRVANVTRGQVAKLEAAGVTTMAALAARTGPVRGMAPETLARLVAQAGLQADRMAGGPAHALRPAGPGKGFDLLPAPDPGDLFYDIEGDPHVEGGLEYLHGLWAPDTGFSAIWAHDREAERAALIAVLDAFRARIAAHPGARIYHYAAYEVTALRRLTAQHGVGEAFLDRLLRERRFVDLYAVVRGGVLASEADYSIKSLEVRPGLRFAAAAGRALRDRGRGAPGQHPLRAAGGGARSRRTRSARMIRFLHTADLHLGKPFGRFPEDLRGRLREARHSSIGRLAAAARANGAADVLVAGDTFDSQTPSPATLRQALQAMAADPGLRWWLLPGNHDSLAAGDLWQRIVARRAAERAAAAHTCAGPDRTRRRASARTLHPAPPGSRPSRPAWPTWRRPRARCASGSRTAPSRSFSEDGNPALIPPDRADTAGLAFLALGDWHGQLRIGARTWYAGTPEADGFKHAEPPGALVVTPGDPPQVTPARTGALAWTPVAVDLLPGDHPRARLAALLPPVAARRDTLLRVDVAGRTGLSGEATLVRACAGVEHDFAWLEVERTGLAVDHAPADLEAFGAPGTALRSAADALRAEADDGAIADEDRTAALTALSRLYAFTGDAAQ